MNCNAFMLLYQKLTYPMYGKERENNHIDRHALPQ